MEASYILPLRRHHATAVHELAAYLSGLTEHLQVTVVDGSPATVFAAHHALFPPSVLHIPVDPAQHTPNGKVGGVLTGMAHARYERVIIADDDVRYDLASLTRVVALLSDFAVVRPQNYFDPLPWYAQLDTARTLLNRLGGGDWPGTLGIRRSYLSTSQGYDGSVLFENLELVRTVKAVGGNEIVPLDLYVRRLPSGAGHFWSQRVRQAYDEMARPVRMLCWLAALPLLTLAAVRHQWTVLGVFGAAVMAMAEIGRRRSDGATVFPVRCSVLAPAWVIERAVCIWLAVAIRSIWGGVRYHGMLLTHSATPMRTLRRRHVVLPSGLAGVSA